MLSFQQFFLSVLQHAGKFSVLSTYVLDPLFNEIDEKRFVRGLCGPFLQMGRFFCDELRDFGPAVVARRHDILKFLQGLVGLIEMAFVVGIVFIGLV